MKKLFILLLAAGAVACKTAHKVEEASVPAETKAAAHQAEASYVGSISFAENSTSLSDSARADLDRLIATANSGGKVDKIKVLTWGDVEYPKNKKELPKAQRLLADKRNKAINEYIKDKTSGVNVDTYNMAERPTKVGEMFNTTDAKIKNAMERAGLNDPESWRSAAHKSKSVVMVIMDRD